MRYRIWIALLVLLMLLAACGREGETAVATPTFAPTASDQTTGAMALPNTPTPSPQPSPTATPQPTATPIVPAIVVGDQTLAEDGQLTIDSVTAPEKSWLVVHVQAEDGSAGEVLGFVPVDMGSSSGLSLTIDPLDASPTLVAMLHMDAGAADEFEFPGPDVPWEQAGDVVSAPFAIEIEFARPAVTVSDQEVTEEGVVRVDSVYAAEAGWLAIHANDEGEPGAMLGHVYLEAGLHEDVPIAVPWREAPPNLLVVLYADGGRPQRLDFSGEDAPVQVNGELVAQAFRVTLPPDIFVLDQPFVNGEIVVERVVSDGPGWLVVHYDDEGELGLIIGFAPLVDGVNEVVSVQLVETAVTDQLYIMLHTDEEPLGEFGFPRSDPQRVYNGRTMDPVPFRINPGNVLFTRDQILQPAEDGRQAIVTVPLVLTDLDTWVVIRRDAEGQPGDIIGQTWLPAGINRQILISVDPGQVTETLYAILHHDADSDQNFDYPEGGDQPLLRNRRIIQAPFTLLPGENS